MNVPLQILCAADEATTASIKQALSASEALYQTVTTPAALQAALSLPWDAVIAVATDGAVPRPQRHANPVSSHGSIDALSALHLVRAVSDAPFLVVADCLSATTAVALIKAGADDYLERDQLVLLPDKIAQVSRAKLEQLQRQQSLDRLKDEFVSTINHELRTPIAALHGSIELLLSGKLGDLSDRGRLLLHLAARNSDRLVRLINDIFDLEQFTSGQVQLQPQSCPIAELIEQAASAVQPIAAQAHINLQLHLQPAQIFADPQRITQVLTNLLRNAIQFSAAGDTIWLTVEQRSSLVSPTSMHAVSPAGSYVVIRVKDQGPGIPADQLEAIFQRFTQVDASDARSQTGAGLGLALCRSIVRQHHGYLWVESQLGVGSIFYLALPIAAAFSPQTGNTEVDDGVKNLLEVARGS
ncbi:MAG: hypothetical protein F6K28_48680 [Microcoleus sp. SIO2G3]|nr:hypothetical protein [Microcoleus sp. SIO2G3]